MQTLVGVFLAALALSIVLRMYLEKKGCVAPSYRNDTPPPKQCFSVLGVLAAILDVVTLLLGAGVAVRALRADALKTAGTMGVGAVGLAIFMLASYLPCSGLACAFTDGLQTLGGAAALGALAYTVETS